MRRSFLSLLMGCFLLGLSCALNVTACSDSPSEEVAQEATTGEEKKGEEKKGEEKPTTESAAGESTSADSGAEPQPADEPPRDEPPKEDAPKPEPNPNVGKIRWSVSVQGGAKSIAISPDGKLVYVVARAFNALNAADGQEAWNIATFGSEMSAPVVGSDGTIYLTTKTKVLYAIDPAKKGTAWSARLTNEGHKFAPALGKDGVVVVAAGNTVQAYKKPGSAVWSANYTLTSKVSSPPAVGPDGTVYVCGEDLSLHAIKPSGEKLWEKNLGGKEPCRYVSIDADGTVYVGGSSLHAFKKDGTIKWAAVSRFGVVSTTVVIHQSFLYFGTFRGKLFKVTKNDVKAANILWENGVTISVNDELRFAPTVGAGGLLYIASIDSTSPEIQFINPTRGKVDRSIASREAFSGHPAIANDGTLYVGTKGGTIYAVWTDSLGLANSPWPRGLRNNRNSSYLK